MEKTQHTTLGPIIKSWTLLRAFFAHVLIGELSRISRGCLSWPRHGPDRRRVSISVPPPACLNPRLPLYGSGDHQIKPGRTVVTANLEQWACPVTENHLLARAMYDHGKISHMISIVKFWF